MDDITDILRQVADWPREDQEELAQVAREIAARRTGIYTLTQEEQMVIAAAREEDFVPDDEVSEFWRRVSLEVR
jgi:cell division protein FtsB